MDFHALLRWVVGSTGGQHRQQGRQLRMPASASLRKIADGDLDVVFVVRSFSPAPSGLLCMTAGPWLSYLLGVVIDGTNAPMFAPL